jgi:hypothetical protein
VSLHGIVMPVLIIVSLIFPKQLLNYPYRYICLDFCEMENVFFL